MRSAAPPVPAYALYGEGADGFPDELHVETITARSAKHDWRIRSHRHGDLYQFFFIGAGGGAAVIDGTAHALGPGAAIALPPLVVHAFDFTPHTDGYVASVPAAVLDHWSSPKTQWRSLFKAPLVLAVTPEQAAQLRTTLELALVESGEHGASRREALTAFAGLVLVWFHRTLAAGQQEGGDLAFAGIQLVERFTAQVEEDFRHHPSLTDRARRLGVSVPHLSRVCRRVTGRSALGIVQERLALEARRHLAYTSMTVAEIAFGLGFEDPAYFTRFFTRHLGVSPRAYRADPSRTRSGTA
ncbi:helix-turn-helix domain-containing protein [Xanthobacter oligotrophicus]|uniref:Helix-turn-helix domain-containing protein n=1 Tax=Xanthobacter oligotrophicus TaxID=2607286 RepID=A0ABW6ZVH8_9HYPH